jgi:hypothetical protein
VQWTPEKYAQWTLKLDAVFDTVDHEIVKDVLDLERRFASHDAVESWFRSYLTDS